MIAAFAGKTAYQPGEGNPPLRESGADPIAAAGHAAAMMLGLFARHRTGEGQHVESAMIVSNIYLNFEDALSYDGKTERRTPRLSAAGPQSHVSAVRDGARRPRRGLRARTRIPLPSGFSCRPTTTTHLHAFCAVAGRDDIAADPRFSSRAAGTRTRRAGRNVLAEVFRTRSAPEWERAAVAAGVGCVMADSIGHFAFLHRDPQADAFEMMTTSEHPSFGGTYWRHAPIVGFSQTPGHAKPFCEKGEHTRQILRDLGYDDEEMTS